MPSGRYDAIGAVIERIMALNPASILDVGSGFGKWGLLLREYLEVWQRRLDPGKWEKQIDALEIWPAYAKLPWYPLFYNRIYVGDVMDYTERLGEWDLVLFLDVIEHLEKEQGQAALRAAKTWIVTTPNYASGQRAVFGNPYEAHRSVWGLDDFAQARVIGGIVFAHN